VQKFSYFLRLGIDFVELEAEEYEKVLDWSAKNDTTYYDGVYVKSSEKIRATLLTADNDLYQKARKEIPTLHLKDYQK